MLKHKTDNNHIIFYCEENGKTIAISEWVSKEYSTHFGCLQELVDNGFGEATSTEFLIPYIGVYELEKLDREALDLPPLYPFDLYIQREGLITNPNFKYTYSFRTFAPNGDILQLISKNGPVIILKLGSSEQSYLLTKDEFLLITAIDEFNNLPASEKNANGNLTKFSEIKSLSTDSAIVLDDVLSSKSVIIPEHIKLSFDLHEGVLDISPCIDGDDEGKFSKMVDGYDEAQDNYPLFQKNGTKTHVVLNEAQKESINEIKNKYRHVKDENIIKRIVENPAEFFDLDTVDVSELYSDRVIDIGLYQPKVYPFVSPYKSQWIPVYKIEDRVNGTTTLAIKNYEDLRKIESAIQTAEDNQAATVCINGVKLAIEQAKEISNNAKSQLDKKEAVGEEEKNTKCHNGTEVLIIKENTEEQEYSKATEPWKMPEKLDLYTDPYLNKAFALKSHQKEGVAWLQCLLTNQQNGCILADDMGMGKTLQVMYAIDWHSRTVKSDHPYLIVAPVSLLENWENEYAKYFDIPRLAILTITSCPKTIDKDFINQLSKKQIVLTSYETLKRGQLNFCAVDFSIIVLDEAQKIKTPGTMITNAAKALKGDFKIAMTGTPVENTFVDLWCITDFAVPGLLGNAKEFAKQYQNPLKKTETDIDALGKDIRKHLDGFFMRRMKESIATELPKKEEITIKEMMPELQLHCYLAALNSSLEDKSKGKMLQLIMRIKAISDHPCLDSMDASQFGEEKLINISAKMRATFHILDDIKRKEEKAIIFTERKEMQRIIQKSILYKYGICPRIVNGETSSKSNNPNIVTRQKAIDNFQNADGFNVIIMSPVATGMGLNVSGANHVIHYSRHWNPAKESQATDRAYRIGQTKNVYVYYPMAIADNFDTFDIILDKLLQRKIHLATSSLYPSEMIEIGMQELIDNLYEESHGTLSHPLALDDVDKLNDYLFEAFIGALYMKRGYDVTITRRSGDKGIDVIASKDNQNYAIQCKHSKNNIGQECMQEVFSGAKYYEKQFGKSFIPCAWTNSHFSPSASNYAKNIEVTCFDKEKLQHWMRETPITMQDVYELDSKRI